MNIDKYIMTVQDEYNIKLSELVPKKEAFGKVPKDGETSEKIIGYFGNLAGAIKKVVHLELNRSTDTTSPKQILKDISALEERIDLKYGKKLI